nr:MAG TPA: hypothetical protein [Caudoviricetes sp.]
MYNTNYKIVILCYASANLIFAQKQEKARFNRTFQGGASVHNGFMKNSGFIGSYTLFSLAHL